MGAQTLILWLFPDRGMPAVWAGTHRKDTVTKEQAQEGAYTLSGPAARSSCSSGITVPSVILSCQGLVLQAGPGC